MHEGARIHNVMYRCNASFFASCLPNPIFPFFFFFFPVHFLMYYWFGPMSMHRRTQLLRNLELSLNTFVYSGEKNEPLNVMRNVHVCSLNIFYICRVLHKCMHSVIYVVFFIRESRRRLGDIALAIVGNDNMDKFWIISGNSTIKWNKLLSIHVCRGIPPQLPTVREVNCFQGQLLPVW